MPSAKVLAKKLWNRPSYCDILSRSCPSIPEKNKFKSLNTIYTNSHNLGEIANAYYLESQKKKTGLEKKQSELHEYCEAILWPEAAYKFKAIPFSNNSLERRIEDLATDRAIRQIVGMQSDCNSATLACIHRERGFFFLSSVKM